MFPTFAIPKTKREVLSNNFEVYFWIEQGRQARRKGVYSGK